MQPFDRVVRLLLIFVAVKGFSIVYHSSLRPFLLDLVAPLHEDQATMQSESKMVRGLTLHQSGTRLVMDFRSQPTHT